MAKKKESALDAEKNKSIGSLMKGKMSQRDRNLAVKAELIKAGKHPEPTLGPGTSNKERNLLAKAKLKEQQEDEKWLENESGEKETKDGKE